MVLLRSVTSEVASVEIMFRHPRPGELVGTYRIVEQLGAGGSGTVFKAERAGLFFTVKMLRSNALGARARREISILLQLEHPCVVRFRACDRWIEPKSGPPYIVTDFVPGPTLEGFAEERNPSARKSARILLDSARTLGDVHLQGVFHRDVKPENIIIHGQNERPVLIDFGVGTYAGAPIITPQGIPPGTYEFRSPEAYRFNRANTELVHYEFSATDEMWALGVTFYWLLVNVLPFGDRNDREREGLAERVIHQRPVAPHLINPRVPRALSDICMRMLEKEPEERYASIADLCEALSGALAEAEADPGWDLPLFDPDAPDTGTDEEELARVDANEDEETRMVRRWARFQPRRGRKPKEEARRPTDADELPPVVTEPNPEDDSTAEARPEADAPRVNAPVAHEARTRAALVLGLVAIVLGTFLWARWSRPRPEEAPLHTSVEATPTQYAGSSREMARSAAPLDVPSGAGARPMEGSIPAPVMSTMPPKHDTSEKPQEKKTKVIGRASKALGTAAAVAALSGCTAAAPQVRSTPEPAPCPQGAVETMKRLGIEVGGQAHHASFLTPKTTYFTAREGDTTLLLLRDWGKLPDDTLLYGRLIFGERRAYVRLTEAKAPGGETFKVCLEVWDEDGGRGAERYPAESTRIFSTVLVRAVSSFK